MSENSGTEAAVEEAQDETAEAATTGTPPADEVTKLRSRNAGLDAKVTELTKAAKAAEQAREEALKKLSEYEAGKVDADEALRAQLAVKEQELSAAKQEAALARIAAQYPETFAVLGEAAAGLSADKLADAEARFSGVPADSEPPKPVGNNPSRTQGAASGQSNPAEETAADIERRLRGMVSPWNQ